MGRYLNQIITTDKAKELEEWVQKLAKRTNRNINSANLYDVGLSFREPFEISGEKYNNGFVSMHIRFASKEPEFLTGNDKSLWCSRVGELAKKRFEINTSIAPELEYASIDFEEPSKEELYILTPNKKSIIESGFDRIRRFVQWYSSAVKEYDGVVRAHDKRMQQYLASLETLSK